MSTTKLFDMLDFGKKRISNTLFAFEYKEETILSDKRLQIKLEDALIKHGFDENIIHDVNGASMLPAEMPRVIVDNNVWRIVFSNKSANITYLGDSVLDSENNLVNDLIEKIETVLHEIGIGIDFFACISTIKIPVIDDEKNDANKALFDDFYKLSIGKNLKNVSNDFYCSFQNEDDLFINIKTMTQISVDHNKKILNPKELNIVIDINSKLKTYSKGSYNKPFILLNGLQKEKIANFIKGEML